MALSISYCIIRLMKARLRRIHLQVDFPSVPHLNAKLMRKRQAAISGEGRTPRKSPKNVDFSSVRTCVTRRAPEEWVNCALADAGDGFAL
jgi:hypothetical protein